MRHAFLVATVLALVAAPTVPQSADSLRLSGEEPEVPSSEVELTTLAFRVHRAPEMEAFYRDAFGFRFRDEQTGPFRSRFGELGPLTIKFVPIRDAVEFGDFPIHQPGFRVPDVEAVIALAERHGGRLEGTPVREGGMVVAASVRDPDGNTIELYRQEGAEAEAKERRRR